MAATARRAFARAFLPVRGIVIACGSSSSAPAPLRCSATQACPIGSSCVSGACVATGLPAISLVTPTPGAVLKDAAINVAGQVAEPVRADHRLGTVQGRR